MGRVSALGRQSGIQEDLARLNVALLVSYVAFCQFGQLALACEPSKQMPLPNQPNLAGFVFRSSSKAWVARGKVTSASCLLMFQKLAQQHLDKPVCLRRKINKQDLEGVAELCAVAINLGAEAQMVVPLPNEVSCKNMLSVCVPKSFSLCVFCFFCC